MFFELRQYRTLPGKMDGWVQFMESEIIPYQMSKGMVIVGSFVGEEEDDLYVWIRRFDSEGDRERLYAAVYENERWTGYFNSKVGEYLDRSKTVITRIEATSKSVIH